MEPSSPRSPNVERTPGLVGPEERARCLGQRGCVVWLTGLSGAGKSTVAQRLEADLVAAGHAAYVLDGDDLRHGLNGDLGFSPGDRKENIRRVGHVAALFADAGLITVCCFVSPYLSDRLQARRAVGEERFLEVHMATPLGVCEERDPKGLYQRARAGEIRDLTGVDAPYEPPPAPELVLDTSALGAEEAAALLRELLVARGFLEPGASGGRAGDG